jgi:hypothetical protein
MGLESDAREPTRVQPIHSAACGGNRRYRQPLQQANGTTNTYAAPRRISPVAACLTSGDDSKAHDYLGGDAGGSRSGRAQGSWGYNQCSAGALLRCPPRQSRKTCGVSESARFGFFSPAAPPPPLRNGLFWPDILGI